MRKLLASLCIASMLTGCSSWNYAPPEQATNVEEELQSTGYADSVARVNSSVSDVIAQDGPLKNSLIRFTKSREGFTSDDIETITGQVEQLKQTIDKSLTDLRSFKPHEKVRSQRDSAITAIEQYNADLDQVLMEVQTGSQKAAYNTMKKLNNDVGVLMGLVKAIK